MSRYEPEDRGILGRFPVRAKDITSEVSRQAMGLTQPITQCAPAAISEVINLPWCGVDQSTSI